MIVLIIDKYKELSLGKLKTEMDSIPADYVMSRKDYGDKMVFFYREQLLDGPRCVQIIKIN